MTLLQHLHFSFSPGAQPYGLTSAKCVLKRREGPFHRPHSPSHHPYHQHLLLFFLPLCPLSLFSYTPSFTHLLAGWHCYHYTGRIYGVRAYGKNKKASVNTCGKHSVSPPPPSTGAHSLIRYALIRHIDHRRDSTSPESSNRTFISKGACKAKTFAALTPANNTSGGVLLFKLANTVSPYVGRTIHKQCPNSSSPAASVSACFSHINNRKADRYKNSLLHFTCCFYNPATTCAHVSATCAIKACIFTSVNTACLCTTACVSKLAYRLQR